MARVVHTPDGLRIELAHLAAVGAIACYTPRAAGRCCCRPAAARSGPGT